MHARSLISLAAFGLAALAAPGAMAQETGSESVNQLIIYGDDPCPQSSDTQITVCARKDEAERFRIPEALRESSSPQNDAWNNRVLAYEVVGKGGTLSCSPTGAGGWTGCLSQMIQTAYAEKKTDETVRFSELISAARQERLAVLDDEAAAEQARVEAAEREHFAKQQADASKPKGEPEGD